MRLTCIEGEFTVCRLGPDAHLPSWLTDAPSRLMSITRTRDELSIVCPAPLVPPGFLGKAEPHWRALAVEGPLAFDTIGIIASITTTLAKAGISVFVLSTFDTDYVLVKQDRLADVATALREAGMEVAGEVG